MTVSKYFKSHTSPIEQKLLRGLVKESIRHKGMDIKYVPRVYIKEDPVYGEDVLSQFTTVYKFEAYVKSFQNYGGRGDILSNFGLEIRDELILTVAVEVFKEVTEGSGLLRPTEGDLIWFPLDNNLWDIKFVEDKSVFFNLGSLYVYDLICTLHEYSNEDINTTDSDIANIVKDLTYTIGLSMGAGSGNYSMGEQVYQGPSLVASTFKGVVVGWNSGTKELLLNSIVGEAVANSPVIGNTSTTSYVLSSVDPMQNINDVENNTAIETQSNSVVDRSEKSPFGNT